MGMQVGGGGGAQADINVTPLVDIVLVLLIIFMVITPLLSKNIEIEVPQKVEDPDPPDEKLKEQMVLKLFADGHFELNKTAFTLENIEAELTSIYKSRDDKVLFFEGEDDAPYGNAVVLMDMAKGAGVATIGIMTPNEAPEEVLGPDGLPIAPVEGAPVDGAVPTEAPAAGG
jgi:biopolymer transport protein TolR